AVAESGIDLAQLKARLFRAIIKAERPHLANVPELLADIEREIKIRFGEENAPILAEPLEDEEDAAVSQSA
ncbi:hypothetical protein, partial [Parvibaculum sp.]